MTVSEQRDGTGTGTWTHPAAEPGQPEPKRCECGMCVWNGHRWTIAKSHNGEPGIALWGNDKGDVVCPGDCKCRLGVVDGQPIVRPPEPRRCECGACWWDGVQWVTRYFEAGDSPEMHSELVVPVAHCPGSCGCRLSVEAGEPRVGEKYADLERDAKRFRVVERAMGTPLDSPFNTHRWHYETDGMDTRYDTLGEYADALGGETDTETGEVEVGPSEAKLLAALQGMIGVVGGCPKVCLPRVGCPANSPAPPPGEACRVDNDNGWQPCWLLHYGLASTYAEAAALWERMGEAADVTETE